MSADQSRGSKLTLEDVHLAARVKPETRRIITLSPFMKIEKEPDGTGGGIRLRLYGEKPDPILVDVYWGEDTEIELSGL